MTIREEYLKETGKSFDRVFIEYIKWLESRLEEPKNNSNSKAVLMDFLVNRLGNETYIAEALVDDYLNSIKEA